MRTWLRRTGYGVGGLAGVLALATAAVYGASEARIRKVYEIEPRPVAVASDSVTLARGRHLVEAVGKCADCHGADLGGKVFIDDPVMGRLIASNLTPAGAGTDRTERDLIRAIRHGIGRDGRSLMIMPSPEYTHFSDEDLGSIVAYLKTLAPVERELPTNTIRVLPRALMLAGKMPLLGAEAIKHDGPFAATIAAGPTKEYGKYLSTVGGCTSCHGPGLSGGPSMEPGAPPAANITPTGLAGWTEADFIRAMRTGKRPNGSPIKEAMPWRATGKLTDDELKATWAFLQSVPPKAYGTY